MCVRHRSRLCIGKEREREEEELCNAYQLINRISNSCGCSYQRVVNHVKRVCLCMFDYACVDEIA